MYYVHTYRHIYPFIIEAIIEGGKCRNIGTEKARQIDQDR